MRPLLRFVVGLLAALVLHLAAARVFPALPRSVDFFLICLVANALGTSPIYGMLGGLVAGLVADALAGGPFGLYGLAGTVVGYGTAFVAQRLVIQRSISAVGVFFAAAVAQQAVLLALAVLVLPQPRAPDWLGVLVKAASTALLGALLFAARRMLHRRVESWQLGRPSRLRLQR